ncbi:unnamed protein product [Soboliphyme baturini]|uniref:GLOBIN domain-containing protein n=1 Tax=Soboliphyme baturini TaxID=241478 RepID=A0A183J324_9BILA|nr:unnamed protein product [Soboliphyme baturini]
MDLINSTVLRDHLDVTLENIKNLIHGLDNPTEFFKELGKAAVAHERTNVKRHHIEALFPILIDTLCELSAVDQEEYEAWKKLFDVMNHYQDMLRTGIIKTSDV